MTLKIIGPNDPALDVLEAALAQHPELNAELEIIPWSEYRDALVATLTAGVAPNQAVFVPGISGCQSSLMQAISLTSHRF